MLGRYQGPAYAGFRWIKTLKYSKKIIIDTVSRLCIEANIHLRKDVEVALKQAIKAEENERARTILNQLLENARVARGERVALCQDTGLPVVFVDIGRGVDVSNIDIRRAINKGVEKGYRQGYLRNSIVRDPLLRVDASRFIPCIIHFNFMSRRGLKLTVLPKGFGSENKTKLGMFNPTDSIAEIKNFIISTIKKAGPDACPPYILGIGIGGTADYAAKLSKEALLRPIDKHNKLKHIAKIEEDLLREANELGLGPMGLGGKTTVLGVNILTYPTHIAGLPVCVNVSCHVLRSASVLLR